MRLGPPAPPPTSEPLTFNRNRRPSGPPDTRESEGARHIIICVDDAFPAGTVRRLEAARPRDCFAVIDAALDTGQGSRCLLAASVREDLEAAFAPGGAGDYQLIAFHIAPTHAHVLIREADGFSLEETTVRWKTSAAAAGGIDRAWRWAPGYFDTLLADRHDVETARREIESHARGPSTGPE